MRITRNSILSAIINRSGLFPNCSVRRKGDSLIIELFNNKGEKKLVLEADIKEMPLDIHTYYGVAEFLKQHPEIKLRSENKKIIEV